MILTILIKKSWGQIRYYPQCPASRLLLRLTGQQCFTKANMATIKEIGFVIEYVHSEEEGEI